MSDSRKSEVTETAIEQDHDRREALRRMGRFAAVTAPSVALLLAAGSKPSQAEPDPVDDIGRGKAGHRNRKRVG